MPEYVAHACDGPQGVDDGSGKRRRAKHPEAADCWHLKHGTRQNHRSPILCGRNLLPAETPLNLQGKEKGGEPPANEKHQVKRQKCEVFNELFANCTLDSGHHCQA